MAVSDVSLRKLTGYRLQRAYSTAMARYKAEFAKFGLRRTTFSCLCLIAENPGMRQSQLGAMLSIERPNLGQIIEDLIRADLVSREVSPTDRRAYAIFPTAKGKRVFEAAFAAIRVLDQKTTAGMTKTQITALQNALDIVEQNSGNEA